MTLYRLATRKSPLALWQAEFVAARLRELARVDVELVPMSTRGDEMLDRSLSAIGGKGLFLKELEEAMADGRADFAVHSLKDVPTAMPEGFILPAMLARHDPRDAMVGRPLDELPQGARVGTASLRRRAQLLAQRPDLQVDTVRGNVNSRLARLDCGEYDALVLAYSGLQRLGLADRAAQVLEPEQCLPASTQGVLAIECHERAQSLIPHLRLLDDAATRHCAETERAVAHALGGSCQVPLAAYARLEGQVLWLRALVASPDGQQLVRAEARGEDGAALAAEVASALLSQGAADILEAI